ncbi:hypothetical protein BDV98DRAFT_559075 [Pterulicium gracile]|uniref:Iron-sulfur assembly protein 1 n=1 Tax=Pterulicium gracile TaxID=1884261 RepID=A0A5C3R5D1_9AGAR|nr:hypothetical protein BDV98DRAFT_559075 [Pterula gracilis]
MHAASLLRVHAAARAPYLHFLYPAIPSSLSRQSRFAMMSAYTSQTPTASAVNTKPSSSTAKAATTPPSSTVPPASLSPDAASPQTVAAPPPAPKPERARPRIRSTRTIVTITPKAVLRLRALLSAPTPQLIRIGTRNKGCAGLQYHLEYVEQPGKFDEIVEQDGVRVLVDSKAMFSIIGSEMDWVDDALSSKFTFVNPNIEDSCGCGESFKVGG